MEATAPTDRAAAALTAAGIKAYRPGEYTGPCKAGYAIVYDGGVLPKTKATGYKVVGVMLLVPLGKREQLDPLLRSAAAVMAGLGLKPRGSPGTEVLDDALKAHAQTIEYTALCAL